MNSPPTPHTTNHPRGHPREFEQIINAKSYNFIGRNFVFTAINQFIHRYHRGYFTIIGAPGSGKSAILAKYALDNPDVVYYNVDIEGKNRADEFLRNICTQLIEMFAISLDNQPENTTEGSWFLSLLLQQISDGLAPNQKLIIAIDGLNFIDRNSQSPGANLFYLPRYLPDGVYFLLTRRPFLREKSGLLIEAPFQSLDLADYDAENQADIQAYIHKNLTPLAPLPYEGMGGQDAKIGGNNYSPLLAGEGLGEGSNLKSWLSNHDISEQEFCTRLTAKSENNFMYVSQVLTAIAEGFYPEPFPDNLIPPGLAAYYQQHLQQMLANDDLSLAVLNALVQQQPTTVDAIAHTIDADEYDVEEILENWPEFLHQEQIADKTHYRLYHSNFRDWLQQQKYEV
ncbi:ATP-binding protein [Nostoc sp. FACHB-152]|uniref:ATP-binding protein n=1 Tax=unclassified Nostoc TaxID=2593658 RepID=UPI00168806FF|nr:MULTISPECIES: ATP-binding protein [unclassified Nostoc]MBD2447511.1 ATP-binding protein [Nostoc sp. FACHB-152]MBD2468321.1 ATP-binding protein [Nostoc sp. FACHB-145]